MQKRQGKELTVTSVRAEKVPAENRTKQAD
jgi:hypothetical protein